MRITIRYSFALTCIFCLFAAGSAKSRVEFREMPCTLLQGITQREYTIYLPESYDQAEHRTYPVVYLLHGGNCSNTDWARYGNLQAITDSLVSIGLGKEMIIVCPEANRNHMIWFNAPHWKYEDFFFREFVPYIENYYRVAPGKENRSVVGYSMGGGASIVYGLHHPEMFHVVYGMSCYLRRQHLELLKDDPSATWRQQLVEDHNPIRTVRAGGTDQVSKWRTVNWFVDCGDKDFTYEANIDLISAFRKQGISYELRVKGGGHDWDYWRVALRDAIIYISQKRNGGYSQ